MKRYYYDFHIHSCLSPCADDDNTPNNIAGMAKLCGLDIIALTDHNSCKNCPAFFEACRRYGIIPVAGAEITTSEDIHIICLFEDLNGAMAFDSDIQNRRTLIKNRTDIFGNQLILDEKDEIIGCEEFFLSNALSISAEETPEYVKSFGGICYPAHIDRQSNGIISVLGTFPETPYFGSFELSRSDKAEEYVKQYSLNDKTVIIGSDAHYLTDIRDKENCFELDDSFTAEDEIRKAILRIIEKK